ncbi:MAG: RHS repeat-associated core domain-containing protein [Ignavibacteriales bacterium]|nr:MAG: RHS repeat-associated core domain-containing protein [Ignavibacteriales bacterium]
MFFHISGLGLEGRAEQTYTWNYETEPPQIERSDDPYYYIKDHLGTIRVTINKQGTILFAADYWPYGEKMAEYNLVTGTVQRYIFTEKERDTETGYDYFGARFYDSDLGRWMTVDPLMDKYPGWSPYNYVMNNPLVLVDPDGMRVNDGGGDEDNRDKEKNKTNILQALSDAWYELQLTFSGSVENTSGGRKYQIKPR